MIYNSRRGAKGELSLSLNDFLLSSFLFLLPPGEMVRQARILAQATSDLVNAIKMDAEGESDLENSRKLLSAAKLLADATAKMVEAAKVWSFELVVRVFSKEYIVYKNTKNRGLCIVCMLCVCHPRVQQQTLTVKSSSRS